MNFKALMGVLLCTITFGIAAVSADACTGIRLIAEDNGVVYGRSMEWGAFDLHSRVSVVPRGYSFKALTPDGKPGKEYTTKYGIVGLDMIGKDLLSDGMNEKGLACGMFYHPGYAVYPEYTKRNARKCISSQEVTNYILGRFASVDEVKEGMKDVEVVGVVEKAINLIIQAHWMVVDTTGKAIVIEYEKGKLMIFDAPLGVITNAPTYDWHVTNLNNFLNLSMYSVEPKKMDGLSFSPVGAGSGMIGLPGDNTPPSRFIRAVAWTQTARKTATAAETVYEVFRILDNFNLPVGPDGGEGASEQQNTDLMRSTTIWTSAWNLTDMVLNYHTQHNRRVRQIDVKKIDFETLSGRIRYGVLDDEKQQDVKDKTADLK
ncbi:linear amide C-N hydrolase [Pseudodesulfovibrio sp. JC047]|uniref:linear amide C-N hydrolase n=1 Tax=Pseudodesulfovibrio sp. JC047 TaxID=2683199 RepID=UPI0013D43016|nr:choloylglycine hydrolase family protein [Pseudodesulfovibrio sp. JC047]NDV18557.1 linear amide C-N hydrolase [Pseudodesulfovibrio sp. JC047]